MSLPCYRTFHTANADIFFDDTLRRVAGTGTAKPLLREKRTILALLKWVFNQKTGSMTMNIRTDSQGMFAIVSSRFFCM